MDNTEYLKQLAETEKKNKQIELEQAKAEALKTIGQQEATTMPTFTAKKQQANVQSQLGAKNLAEYWANRGQTQAGISAQAELSRKNVLDTNIGQIGQAEMAQQETFNQARDTAETGYQNQLTNFSNQVDQELTSNLYKDKLAQQQAQAEAEKYAYEQQQKQAQQAFENQMKIKSYNLSAYNATKDKEPKNIFNSVGNFENVKVPYTVGAQKPITGAVMSGDKVVYQLSNGSTLKFDKGTNPYTGTVNKDALGLDGSLKVFDNGFQPNNIDGKPISTIDAGNGQEVKIDVNGDILRVWKTSSQDKGSKWNPFDTKTVNKYYYWDAPTNKYQSVPSETLKELNLK